VWNGQERWRFASAWIKGSASDLTSIIDAFARD